MSSLVVLNLVYLLSDFLENWCRVNHALLTGINEFLSLLSTFKVGRDSVVGIATRYGLDGPGDRISVGAKFSAPVPAIPGTHPASYTMGTGSLSRGVKRPRRDVDHPHPSTAEVKERVDQYVYSPSGPSWHVLGRNVPLPLLSTLNVRFMWMSVGQSAGNAAGLFSHTKEGPASLMGVGGITFTRVS
jgi:hypothetical protein